MFGLDQPLPKPKFSPRPQLLVDVMNQLFFFAFWQTTLRIG